MTYTIGQQSLSNAPHDHGGSYTTQTIRLTMRRVASVSFGDITLQDRDEYAPGVDAMNDFESGTWYKKLADVDVASGNAFVDTRYVQENLVFPELVDGEITVV